jgi:exodeoxyribonuclease-3
MQRADIDVLAMQEIKCKPDQFPMKQFNDAGYQVVLNGLNQWNGVAFASRMPAEDVEIGFADMPGFGPELAQEARAIGATFNGVRLWSLYVPNGRTLEDPHYQYKLEWLDRLAAVTSEWIEDPSPLALMGDFNIAPLDTDVWDIDDFIGATHVSEPERQAFEAFEQIGLQDVVRPLIPEGYTYWDYQQLRFPKNEGMRIDFILGNETFAEAVTSAEIVRDERKGEQPSDHVPVVVNLATS